MMKEIKCECGHVNPAGTVLCESCGKPLVKQDAKLLDMRYDGSARRSQTYNKTIVDKIWNFFSSVKVGVWLIVITLTASALERYFRRKCSCRRVRRLIHTTANNTGFGQIYYALGFHNLYGSWWFIILVASIGISLVICSLDRVVPLYRALKTRASREIRTLWRGSAYSAGRKRTCLRTQNRKSSVS